MKKPSHLTLVDNSNPNPENLSYDQIEDKINGLVEVLHLAEDLNVDMEFPHLEQKIKYYIELQKTLEVNPPPTPEIPEETLPSNVIDMSLVFQYRTMMNTKKLKNPESLPENVVLLFSGSNSDEDVG